MAVNFYFQKGEDVIDIESTFKVRVTSVRGLLPSQPKELFKRDWAGENGTYVHVPADRKRKAGEVTLTMFSQIVNPNTAQFHIEKLLAYVQNGVITYWDTLRNRTVDLVYDSSKPLWEQYIPSNEQIMLELTMINPTGLVTTEETEYA